MATVVYSPQVSAHVERALQILRAANPAAAPDMLAAITSAVGQLAAHPLLGRRITGEIRELVISYGRTGCVAFYRFVVPRDEVRVLAIGQQREIGFVA